MEYFHVLHIQDLKEAITAENKTQGNGIAISIALNEFENSTTNLIAINTPHCYCIYISSNEQQIAHNNIDEIIPFFFGIHYLKINSSPLLVISLPAKNIVTESKLTEQFTSAAFKQGFNKIALQFIYRDTPSNLNEPLPLAYYLSVKEGVGIDNGSLKKVTELLLSGKLVGRFVFIDSKQATEVISTINKIIEEELSKNQVAAQLLTIYAKLLDENNKLLQRSLLLEQQLQNTEAFLGLTRDSFNHDLHWYKSEAYKIKEWSTAEVKRLKEWHYWQYEVLPPWFKKLGKRILRFSKPKKGFEE